MADDVNEGHDEINQQAREQVGGRQVKLRIDERNMTSQYANAFRSNGTAEEVILDFGLNLVNQGQPGGPPDKQQAEILFQINNRIIMNYYSAKRLAIALSQLVRRHEEQFGELKLNAADRVKK